MVASLGLLIVFGVACSKPLHETPRPAPKVSASASLSAAVGFYAEIGAKSYPLPSVHGPVNLDPLTYDAATGRIWIPLVETGSVAVFSIATSTFTEVDRFETAEVWGPHGTQLKGPRGAAVGDGVVYIGNPKAREVCVVDEATLELGACLRIPTAMPDVLTYVGASKELWVTTPREESIVVFDTSKPDKLETKLVIKAGGIPEECALDPLHGIFYTKLAAKNRVFAFDVKTHTLLGSWPLGCEIMLGLGGIAVDSARNYVFAACANNGLEVHDGANDGALLGRLDTGYGVHGIDYVAATKRLYVAASSAARLSTVEVSAAGVPSVAETIRIPDGARNAIADSKGTIFIVDPKTARLLVFAPK
jgi:DNA-binding beta-propeller fold protein YncE